MTDNPTADESIAAGFPPAMTTGFTLYDIETFLRVYRSEGGIATADSLRMVASRGLIRRSEPLHPDDEKDLVYAVSAFYVPGEIVARIEAWEGKRAARLGLSRDANG